MKALKDDHILKKDNPIDLDESNLIEEDESFLNESIFLKMKNKIKHSAPIEKNVEVANIKHLPTLFFITFTLLIGLISIQFFPAMTSTLKTSSLYEEKMKLKYIPEYFGDQISAVKVNNII